MKLGNGFTKDEKILVKHTFDNVKEIVLSSGSCWHIKEINKKYVRFKSCFNNSEYKYFWDFEEIDEVTAYILMKKIYEKKKNEANFGGECRIDLLYEDYELWTKKKKKEKKYIQEEIEKEILGLMNAKEKIIDDPRIFLSDVMLLNKFDFKKAEKIFETMEKKKLIKKIDEKNVSK